MEALYQRKQNSAAELKVKIDADRWEEALKKAFKKVAAQVEIKGFRKGHAPAELIRKAVNPREIQYQAIDEVAQEALNYGLEQYPEIRLVDRPSLDVESMDDKQATLLFLLTVYPEVKLGDYKALKYEEKKVSILKKDLDVEIQHLLEHNAEEVLKEEGTINKGDIAVIDFEGFKDGVPFDGGKGTEYPLEIGSGSFIPGFEEQLIGMAIDEEKDLNVTFPENYGVAELAGQPVVFHVKVDGIKEKKLPELTDAFVEELKLAENVKTVDEMTKYIKEQMKNQAQAKNEEEATNKLLDELSGICEVEIPEIMIEDEVKQTFDSYVSRIQNQGIGMDMYYKIMGTDEKGFKEQIRPEAEKKVRIRLILEAVADDMKVTVSDEEVAEELEAMSKEYGMEVDKLKELVPVSYLQDDLKMRKALEGLKQKAPKKEKAPKEEGEAKPAKKTTRKAKKED